METKHTKLSQKKTQKKFLLIERINFTAELLNDLQHFMVISYLLARQGAYRIAVLFKTQCQNTVKNFYPWKTVCFSPSENIFVGNKVIQKLELISLKVLIMFDPLVGGRAPGIVVYHIGDRNRTQKNNNL